MEAAGAGRRGSQRHRRRSRRSGNNGGRRAWRCRLVLRGVSDLLGAGLAKLGRLRTGRGLRRNRRRRASWCRRTRRDPRDRRSVAHCRRRRGTSPGSAAGCASRSAPPERQPPRAAAPTAPSPVGAVRARPRPARPLPRGRSRFLGAVNCRSAVSIAASRRAGRGGGGVGQPARMVLLHRHLARPSIGLCLAGNRPPVEALWVPPAPGAAAPAAVTPYSPSFASVLALFAARTSWTNSDR